MLERLARTKAILENPKNRKMKRFIDTSVAANGPMLETLMRKGAEYNDITLIIDTMFKQNLEFGTRLPKGILIFSRKAATAWNKTPAEERENAGLDPELCRLVSPASTFFSNAKRGNTSFGILINAAENKRSMIRRWKLLLNLQHGSVPFEKVQDFFLNEAKECLQLTSYEATKEGVKLSGERAQIDEETGKVEIIPGGITLVHRSIYSNITAYEEQLSLLKDRAANRLIVGYSPVLH
jgi:hypothetical protein